MFNELQAIQGFDVLISATSVISGNSVDESQPMELLMLMKFNQSVKKPQPPLSGGTLHLVYVFYVQ